MKTLIALYILCPFLGSGQHPTYFTIAGHLLVPREIRHTAGGVDISGNILLTDKIDVGIATGVTRFTKLPSLYIPVSAKLSFFPSASPQVVTPFFVLESGYGYYNASEQTATNLKTTNGGFSFSGHAGLKRPVENRWRPFLSIGYGKLLFREVTKSNVEGIDETRRRFALDRISLKLGIYL